MLKNKIVIFIVALFVILVLLFSYLFYFNTNLDRNDVFYEFDGESGADKILLNSYLINMIGYYQYNNDLLLINWKNYDIDKLSIKELENLMFDLHNSIIMNNKNKKYSSINLCKNILNKKFKKLNKKYYDK